MEIRPRRGRCPERPEAAAEPGSARRQPVAARGARSGRLDSNQRSPVPETGGVADLPYDQMVHRRPWSRTRPVPAYQTGAFPRSPVVVETRREESNLRLPPSRGGALLPLSYGETRWSSGESNPEFTGANRACSR